MSRRKYLQFLKGLLIGVAFCIVPLFPLPASAFFVPGGNCNPRESFSYGYDGPNWTNDREDWFEDGITAWEEAVDFEGEILSFASEGGSIEIQLNNFYDGQGGRIHCFLGGLLFIEIDVDELGNPTLLADDDFRGVAAHELGHAFGLHHVYRTDSREGTSQGPGPTMTDGCFITSSFTFADEATIESDDWAALASSRFSEVQANASFEGGMQKWSVAHGTWNVPTSGGDVGSRFAQIGFEARLAQRVRLIDSPPLTPALSIRKGTSNATGEIRVEVRARELDYDSSGQCLDDTPHGWDLAAPTVGSWVDILEESFTPTTSWTEVTLPEWDDVADWDGAEVEITVFNELSAGWAEVDYVRTGKDEDGGGGDT